MRTESHDRVGRSIFNLLLLLFAVLLFAFASAVAQVLVSPDRAVPTHDSQAAGAATAAQGRPS